MFDWNTTVGLVRTGKLDQLVRTPRVAQQYRVFRDELARKGSSLLNNILENRLHWSGESLAGLEAQYPDCDRQAVAFFSRPDLYAVLPNDFPYDLEADVHHLVVWSKVRIPLYKQDKDDPCAMDLVVRDKIDRFLQHNLARYALTEFVWFINYPHLQSVKTVSHVHVLVRAHQRNPVIQLLAEDDFEPVGES
ncbi:LAMI_0E06986g1_1 [Lachancea mirantina]|uniref:LAMI_0E06986g1_1 n=1 Tax=Lachancea mirantina TaxID=1230905 RepID=A0A1G4JMD9_9SACH|nr:LAMI_0E06986g1_1 [Lachancea mirantina]